MDKLQKTYLDFVHFNSPEWLFVFVAIIENEILIFLFPAPIEKKTVAL